MTKTQFWILNILACVCALLVVGAIALLQWNRSVERSLMANQQQINRAEQVHSTFRNLALRVAQSAQTNSELRDLLARHELKVSSSPEAKPDKAP